MAGRITTRQVTAKAVERVEVQRVRIPKNTADRSRQRNHASENQGIRIGDTWIIFTRITANRVDFTVDASRATQILPVVPVVLDC